ncbi:MAG: hypothetical protein NTV97_16090 [Alphaproteobacteria bacterium]|nr:hypothetical protein [Alphaproteobacteria bacterium]
MRFILPLALVVLAVPAAGQTLDCTTLKSSLTPFATTYEVKRSVGSATPTSATEQSQIFRKSSETVVYTVLGPGRYLRVRSTASPLLPVEAYISSPPRLRRWSYSIDPNVDHLARRQPLDFTAEQRNEDGSVFMKARMTVSFSGTEKVQFAGCSLDVVKMMRTVDGTADGRPIANRTETRVSPELRTALFTRIEDPNYLVTYTATGVSLDFKPVE